MPITPKTDVQAHIDNLNAIKGYVGSANKFYDVPDGENTLDFLISFLTEIREMQELSKGIVPPNNDDDPYHENTEVVFDTIELPYVMVPLTIPGEFHPNHTENDYRCVLLENNNYSFPIHIKDPVWHQFDDDLTFDDYPVTQIAIDIVKRDRKGNNEENQNPRPGPA